MEACVLTLLAPFMSLFVTSFGPTTLNFFCHILSLINQISLADLPAQLGDWLRMLVAALKQA